MVSVINWTKLRQKILIDTQRTEMYNPNYWDKDANTINENLTHWDELTKKQLQQLSLSSELTVLDIGAGTGRLTLPIAKHVKHITALEPSETMLTTLKNTAQKQQTFNISYINKSLEELTTTSYYDLIVASFSLFMFDIKRALMKIDTLATKGVYFFMSASPWMDEGVQKAINGPLSYWSDFIFIYNILYSLGISANVAIHDYELKQSYDDFELAVLKLAQINNVSPKKKTALQDYLRINLVEDNGKLWYNRKRKMATIWWNKNK
ncbi:MAG: class I SAM-dependent methyltransferase [Candidatus Bathyarchaeota archaeon]|nr:class I SAM-dependent methyltransferase [Candidatus Termiticorpusculum sp.]